MTSPSDPAETSVAPAGEIATVPKTLKSIEVTDENEQVVGLLIKWDAAMWLWADADDYADLSESQ